MNPIRIASKLPSGPLRVVGLAVLLAAPAVAAQVLSQSSPAAARSARAPAPVPGDRQVNVLVILCDQFNVRMLGHEDNGYGGVNQSLTPSLDQLASGGVRFSNAACSAAVCQASRYSILTGRWPHNHGVRVNSIWEPRGETTLPELARAVGYKTANIGKHHLIWPNQPAGWGDDHGFDEIVDEGDYGAYCASNGMLTFKNPANVWLMPNLPAHGGFEETGYTFNQNEFHPSGYWADEVIRFLGERAGPGGDGKPFVCWYSMIGPHPPMLPSGLPPDDWAHLYHPYSALQLAPSTGKVSTTARLSFVQSKFTSLTDDQSREALSYYYGLISQIDWNIGRVLDELDALGLADDTLVVFTTDHGEMASEMSCWTKGAGSYDALTRVPLLVRLPGVVPAGKTVSAPVSNIDIFPTLVEATGVPVSDQVRAAVDGVSLLDLMIRDGAPSGWRKQTFHELGTSLPNPRRHFMVRTPTAKYAMDELDGSEEFYDLANDPFEITDLINDPNPLIQAQIADLKSRFAQWWNNTIGHAPHYQPIGGQGSSVPVPGSNPMPFDNATGVSRDVDPSWLPCTGAALQNVYFGADSANLTLFAALQHMETSFNPGSLSAAGTYYWRVDQINANATVAGPVWSFTTEPGGSGGPGLATSPTPAHRATKVPRTSALSWSVGPGTLTQDIYLGPAGDLQLVAAGVPATTTSLDSSAFSAGVSYEWRVDGIDLNGVTAGDVWTFEVSSLGLARRARAIAPAHLERDVPDGSVLLWASGPKVLSHDVYFGSSFPLAFQGNQHARWWDPGPLSPGQVYYWRIDQVNDFGTTTGWTWRFGPW